MVSNATDRSRTVTTVTSPLSRACRMSFIILSRAVSVLCPGLYADWEVGKRLLAFNTLDNWGHKTPTQSKRIKDRKEKIKGSWPGTCIQYTRLHIHIYLPKLLRYIIIIYCQKTKQNKKYIDYTKSNKHWTDIILKSIHRYNIQTHERLKEGLFIWHYIICMLCGVIFFSCLSFVLE